jgi:ABC-2 type transport system ATP-binding protein
VILNETINLSTDPVKFRKHVNYSEAEPLFPSFLTANDLIRFVGKAKNSTDSQQEQVLHTLGVDTFLHQSCGTFSSGMLKKLSLAMAFLGEPNVLILDEPLISLDEYARSQLLEMIELLLAKDVIILVSSHQHFQIDEAYITRGYEIIDKALQSL